MEMEVPTSRYGRKYKRPMRCSACENCTHGAAAAAPVSADALSERLAQVLKVSDQVEAAAAGVAVAAVAAAADAGIVAAAAAVTTTVHASSEVYVGEAVELVASKQTAIDGPGVQQLEEVAETSANAEETSVNAETNANAEEASVNAEAANAPAALAAGKNKKRNARKNRVTGDAARRAPLAAKGENGTQNAANENVGVPAVAKVAPQAKNVLKKENNPQKDQKEPKEQKEPKGKKGQIQNKAKDGKENVAATRQSGRRQRSLKEIQVPVK